MQNTVLEEKYLLKDVSGVAYPGELLVIMGSSGAGKTTLLNCMTFRNLKRLNVSGLICINDAPTAQTQLAFQSAYVQQDDLFVGYLTVKEHLIFQSMLTMDSYYSYEERLERVEAVMKELSLEKCEHGLIGYPGTSNEISRGERKRLALASNFLTNPPLLFCDEPTTGLDSYMALNIVQMLKDLAKSGKTVIATLHQPSSEVFQLFDKICLLAEGKTAFLGTTSEAGTFFTNLGFPCPKNFNPAEHYIQLLSFIPGRERACERFVEDICVAFKESISGIRISEAAEKVMESVNNQKQQWTFAPNDVIEYKVGWFTQMKALLWRTWLCILRDPEVTRTKFISVLVEVCFFGIIYYGQTLNQVGIKNLDGMAALFVINVTYQNVFGTINTFCGELPLFMKEHKDGMYRTDVYYLSKIICDLPFTCTLAMMYPAFDYYIIGFNPEITRFVTALFTMVLVCQTTLGIGYIISISVPRIELAEAVIGIVVYPFLIFGGFVLNFGSVPSYLQWLANLSWFKYGYEMLMINQWTNIDQIQCNTNTTISSYCLYNGTEVLQSAAILPGEFLIAVGSLCSMIIGCRLVAYLCLLFRASQNT